MNHIGRDDRLHQNDRAADQRTPGQRDRDRILHSSAFRRIGGVTQVAAANERHVFHNRLTHTLKVAQIARRLAEYAVSDQPDLVTSLGGIDPDVVESAALAHDLGHPPFGHIAERLLDELVKKSGNLDGFEGNPQSFRIVTKLALRHSGFTGLNLTRATLNAILKYPWFRITDGGERERKWGAYRSEESEFRWARELSDSEFKSPEAELMDWADDIAYSVHDVEDFYRGGLIPLDRLLTDQDEPIRFLEKVFNRWEREGRSADLQDKDELTQIFKAMIGSMRIYTPLFEPYSGTRVQRAALRSLTAELIKLYVTDTFKLREPDSNNGRCIEIMREYEMSVKILKELTWEYVINNPALATQQYGQRNLISDLFRIFQDAASKSDFSVFPPMFSEHLQDTLPKMARDDDRKREIARSVADYISGMTERQAIEIHQRLTGVALGSLLDPVVY